MVKKIANMPPGDAAPAARPSRGAAPKIDVAPAAEPAKVEPAKVEAAPAPAKVEAAPTETKKKSGKKTETPTAPAEAPAKGKGKGKGKGGKRAQKKAEKETLEKAVADVISQFEAFQAVSGSADASTKLKTWQRSWNKKGGKYVWAPVVSKSTLQQFLQLACAKPVKAADGKLSWSESPSYLTDNGFSYDSLYGKAKAKGAKKGAKPLIQGGQDVAILNWYIEETLLPTLVEELIKIGKIRAKGVSKDSALRIPAGGSVFVLKKDKKTGKVNKEPSKITKDNVFKYLDWKGKSAFNAPADADNVIYPKGIPKDIVAIFCSRWAKARKGSMKNYVTFIRKNAKDMTAEMKKEWKALVDSKADDAAKIAFIKKAFPKANDKELSGSSDWSMPAIAEQHRIMSDKALGNAVREMSGGIITLSGGLTPDAIQIGGKTVNIKDKKKSKTPLTAEEKIAVANYQRSTSSQAMVNKIIFDVLLNFAGKITELVKKDGVKSIKARHIAKVILEQGFKKDIIFMTA